MALKNLFATGPRIKLRSGNKVIGYALGFNINISTEVTPVYVLGSYAPVSLEPTMYNTVTGTMQIMRLVDKKISAAQATTVGDKLTGAPLQAGVDANTGLPLISNDPSAIVSNDPASQALLYEQIDPRTILKSSTFDVSLYLKLPTQTNGIYDEVLWMTIKDCRITSRNTTIAMGQLVNTPINFQGLLATPHSSLSGAAQLFQLDQTNVES